MDSSKQLRKKTMRSALLLVAALMAEQLSAHGNTPDSLEGVAIPPTKGLLNGKKPIVVNKKAAIQLGKALFWDIAVGSDGMACASCHFHAGADSRTVNQLSTGELHNAPEGKLFGLTPSGGTGGVNYSLRLSDFPLHQFVNPKDKNSAVLFTTDDVVASAGTFNRQFIGLNADGNAVDDCQSVEDAIFHNGSFNTRQVQKRNTPTVINAAFNFRNFWDGSANNIFNGVSPYGLRDVKAAIWVAQEDGTTRRRKLRLENASLASQAVTPPINDHEMSCSKRSFADVARKLLPRRPLAEQTVHPKDSVLANLRDSSGKGLATTYESLIKTAFAPRFWSGTGNFGKPNEPIAAPYQHIEANFSLFFGLALQLYEDTLVSDQAPFDKPRIPGTFPEIPEGFTEQQTRGLNVFLRAECAVCHKGPTLSAAAHPDVFTVKNSFGSLRLVNRKTLSGAFSGIGVVQGLLDEGYFNTSVTSDNHDIGVGGTDPYGNPLSFSEQYSQKLLTGKPMVDPIAVNSCELNNPFFMDFPSEQLIADPYITGGCGSREIYAKIPTVAAWQAQLKRGKFGKALIPVKGAFKVPTLRNIELTGPYMHNGSMATLEQVVDFYFRGGNFKNTSHFTALVFPQLFDEQDKADLVAFLKTLTDERVRWERAPFDHPELVVPHGHTNNADANHIGQAQDQPLTIPAVGKNGRSKAIGKLLPFDQYLAP